MDPGRFSVKFHSSGTSTRLTKAADEPIYQATDALFVTCARHPLHLAIAGRQPRQLVGGIEHESVGLLSQVRRTPGEEVQLSAISSDVNRPLKARRGDER